MDQLEEQRCMQYAETLGTLIRCETVSVLHDVNPEKFRPFHTLLEKTFPHLYTTAACSCGGRAKAATGPCS